MDDDLDFESILNEIDSEGQGDNGDHGNSVSNRENINSTDTNALKNELKLMQEKVLMLQKQLENKNNDKKDDTKPPRLKEVDIFDVQPENDLNFTENKSTKQLSIELFGDHDSSDDEEAQKYPLENRGLNEYGKFIKQRLSLSTTNNDTKARENESPKTFTSTKNKTSSLKIKKDQKNFETEYFSGINIINPLVPSSVMKDKMDGRRLIRMTMIHNFIRGGEIDGDWVTIGVIIAKTEPKVSSKGKTYSIWRMSDLRDCSKIVSFFLFGKVHQNHWKSSIGTVVGILNPASMSSRESTSSKYANDISFSIDHQDKVMILGMSKDFGHCRARKKDGGQCSMVVNNSVCEYCPFHIQAAYKKTSRKRTELQSSYSSREPNGMKKKLLQNQQIFYGGQTYTNPTTKNSVPKKNNLSLGSLKLQTQAEQMELDFKSSNKTVIPDQSISESFGELMSIPSVGSRNLIKHLVLDETKKPEYKCITASELLKMHKQKFETKKRNLTKNNSPPFSLIKPVIGAGLHVGQSVNLRFARKPAQVLTNTDVAKLRALQKIRQNGVIEKIDPNAVKKVKNEESVLKLKKRVENDDDEPKTKRQHVDNDEFQRILNAKSLYADALTEEELEQQEKYFDQMEFKEKLESKMNGIQEIQCKAVSCKICKYTALSASARCKEERHPLKVHNAIKRFFKCKNCKSRTISLNKLPTKPCSKCGNTSYDRCAMKDERSGPKLESEQLSIRGNEVKFLNSFNVNGSNINI